MGTWARNYFIGGLVIVLVSIHATTILYVRSQATQVRVNTSSEVSLGEFVISRPDAQHVTRLQLFALLPLEHRLSGRKVLEANFWLLHESYEEYFRQVDPELLLDPSLIDVKNRLLEITTETLGHPIAERILVTNLIALPTQNATALIPTPSSPTPMALPNSLAAKRSN